MAKTRRNMPHQNEIKRLTNGRIAIMSDSTVDRYIKRGEGIASQKMKTFEPSNRTKTDMTDFYIYQDYINTMRYESHYQKKNAETGEWENIENWVDYKNQNKNWETQLNNKTIRWDDSYDRRDYLKLLRNNIRRKTSITEFYEVQNVDGKEKLKKISNWAKYKEKHKNWKTLEDEGKIRAVRNIIDISNASGVNDYLRRMIRKHPALQGKSLSEVRRIMAIFGKAVAEYGATWVTEYGSDDIIESIVDQIDEGLDYDSIFRQISEDLDAWMLDNPGISVGGN